MMHNKENIILYKGSDFMSLPNIPNIIPDIKLKKEDVLLLLLISIGLEQLSLTHIENALGDNLDYVIGNNPSFNELIQSNISITRILRTILQKDMLLQHKPEDILTEIKTYF